MQQQLTQVIIARVRRDTDAGGSAGLSAATLSGVSPTYRSKLFLGGADMPLQCAENEANYLRLYPAPPPRSGLCQLPLGPLPPLS